MAWNDPIITALMKALNIDTSKVKKVTINIEVNDIVTVDTVGYVFDEEIEEMTEVVKRYRLTTDEIIEPVKDNV